jgi:hypothetical protein
MTFRGFLNRIGLAPLSEVRGLQQKLLERNDSLIARNYQLIERIDDVFAARAERDALRAENANLKRAAAERLRDEGNRMVDMGNGYRVSADLVPSFRFTHPTHDPGEIHPICEPRDHAIGPYVRSVERVRAAGIDPFDTLDCLEGDKPRAG